MRQEIISVISLTPSDKGKITRLKDAINEAEARASNAKSDLRRFLFEQFPEKLRIVRTPFPNEMVRLEVLTAEDGESLVLVRMYEDYAPSRMQA